MGQVKSLTLPSMSVLLPKMGKNPVNNQVSVSLKEEPMQRQTICSFPSAVLFLKSQMNNNKDKNSPKCTAHTLPTTYPAARLSETCPWWI